MNSILSKAGFLFPLLLFVAAMLGFLIETRGIALSNKNAPSRSHSDDKGKFFVMLQNSLTPFLFFLIIACAVGLSFLLGSLKNVNTPLSATATFVVTPAPPSVSSEDGQEDTPIELQKKFYWLDEVSPMIKKDKNFFFKSWGDSSEFKLDDRAYSHGLGMRICGTKYEGSVPAADAPYNTDRYDCRQVYIEFALRSEYESLSFSIGVDNGNKIHYGPEEQNGVAQVVMIDKDRNETLFDTGWVNYAYAQYDASIRLTNVENLKIVYRTSGIPHKSPVHRLQFVIVDPILLLVED